MDAHVLETGRTLERRLIRAHAHQTLDLRVFRLRFSAPARLLHFACAAPR